MKGFLLASVVMMAGLPALAQEHAKQVSKTVHEAPVMPIACPQTPFGTVCQHIFGGRTTRVTIPAIPDEPCESARVQLYQLSERLSTPVGEPVKATCREAVLDIPEVKTLTYYSIRRVAVTSRGAEKTDTDIFHAYTIAVYPQDNFVTLREWSEKNNLVVFDPKEKLTELLTQQRIPIRRHTDVLQQGPEIKTICLWLPGHEDDQKMPDLCTASVVLHPLSGSLPVVYVRESRTGRALDAFLPALLPSIGYHPLSQRMFIELIESSLQGAAL